MHEMPVGDLRDPIAPLVSNRHCEPHLLLIDLVRGQAGIHREYVVKRRCGETNEPRRVCRRPQLLRGRVYDEQDDEQVLA